MSYQLTFVKSPRMYFRILHAAERNSNMGDVIVSAPKKSYLSGLHAVLWKWRASEFRKPLRITFLILISFASETYPRACGAI
jgi:hypothetical protein